VCSCCALFFIWQLIHKYFENKLAPLEIAEDCNATTAVIQWTGSKACFGDVKDDSNVDEELKVRRFSMLQCCLHQNYGIFVSHRIHEDCVTS
jgi:hypothetical protein